MSEYTFAAPRLSRITAAVIAAFFVLGAQRSASAQEVTGVVRVAVDTTRIAITASDAAVVLLDSTGAVVAGAITRDDGRFILRGPAAGTYRVVARRIGLAPDSSAKIRLADSVAFVTLTLRPFATVLAQVYVAENRRCTITPTAGSLALRLWEDVRSALTAAIITQSDGSNSGMVLTRFRRQLEPRTGRVIQSTSWHASGSNYASFGALPADTLAAHGFVIVEQGDVIYYAPDARTLLSAAFARTHCFRPATDAQHAGLVGLAFDAVRDTNQSAQVSGTLWLDSATKELRELEFRYLDGKNPDRDETDKAFIATGRIDYERLSDGAWIIRHWKLHIPVVEIRNGRSRLISVWELGGDATTAPPPSK